MQKKWLIDAHNVMHKIPDLSRQLKLNAFVAISAFCDQIEIKCAKEGMRACLVFDGVPQLLSHKKPSLEVLFSRERTADEVIFSMLKKTGASRQWILVSDDREIRQRAFYYSVDIVRTHDFLNPKSTIEKHYSTSSVKVSDPGKLVHPNITEAEVSELLKLMTSKK